MNETEESQEKLKRNWNSEYWRTSRCKGPDGTEKKRTGREGADD